MRCSLTARPILWTLEETLIYQVPFMVRCFDRLSITTSGINNLPFVLSLSKDLFSVSLTLLRKNSRRVNFG